MTEQMQTIAREAARETIKTEGTIITAEVVRSALAHQAAATPATPVATQGASWEDVQLLIGINARKEHYSRRNRSVFVPNYFYPDFWENENAKYRRLADASDVIPFLIINPASGPGDGPESPAFKDWQNQLKRNRLETGQKFMGYIRSDYGRVPLDSIMQQAEQYSQWYDIEDFFIDEAAHGKGEQAKDTPYYLELRARLKKCFPAGLIAVNPGTLTSEDMVAAGDYLMTFEREAAMYEATNWLQEEWYTGQPRQKFWHCIHDVTSFDQAVAILKKADTLNVGNIYVTDDTIGDRGTERETNPYDTLPARWLWNLQVEWARNNLNGYLQNLQNLQNTHKALAALPTDEEAVAALAKAIKEIRGE